MGGRGVWVLRIGSDLAVAECVERSGGDAGTRMRVEGRSAELAQVFAALAGGSESGARDVLVIDPAATVRLLHLPVCGPRALPRERLAEMVRWEMAPWVGGEPDGESVCATRHLGPNGHGQNLHAWVATAAPRRRRDELRELAASANLRLRGVVAPAAAAAALAPSTGTAHVLATEGDRIRIVRVEGGVPVADRERSGAARDAADLIDADASSVLVADTREDAAALGDALGRPCESATADLAAAVASAHAEGRLLAVPPDDPPPPLWRRPAAPALAGAALAAVAWAAGDAHLAGRERHAAQVRELHLAVRQQRDAVASLQAQLDDARGAARFVEEDVTRRREAVSALLAALRERCGGRARLRQVCDAEGGGISIVGAATDAADAQRFHTELGRCLAEFGWSAGPFAIRRDGASGAYAFTARLGSRAEGAR